MKKSLHLYLTFFLLFTSFDNLSAAPFDTGMITLQQPDQTEFTGRIWGDEFFFWAETEAGYSFIQSGDGWYYYTTLDQSGEFAPTTYKVGINSPPAYSYQLDRTQARIDEINEQIEEFNEQIEINKQWYAQKQDEAQGQPVTLKIGIILIEFKDFKRYKSDPQGNRPDGYFTADFDSMMFSYNYWEGGINNLIHPEGEEIFGSFRDYWDQMSMGKLKITGKVVNPDKDEDGVPDWLEADSTREFYSKLPFATKFDSLANEAIQKAIDSGYVSENQSDTNYYDKYAIVYARQAILAGALSVHAQKPLYGGKYHFLAERSGFELYGPNPAFTHIGIYAHEFGHTIGFYDEYKSAFAYNERGGTDLFNFCLMARGIYNGPGRKAACPATLSPYYRIEKRWLPEPVTINSDQQDFYVEYDYEYPNLYRIDPIESSEKMHYLLEVKHREGFDEYIPEPPGTFQNQTGTLIIWQHNIESHYVNPYYDRIRIKAADFISDSITQLNDFFPSDQYQNYQSLNDTTYPTASLGDSDEELYTFKIRPAHFALNGIQKQENNNIIIDEIILHHPLRIVNKNAGGWQAVSVPYGLTDYYYKSIFPTCTTAYKFDGTYISVDTLENGPGYWVNFPIGIQWLPFQGTLIEYLEIPVDSGWNLTGSIPYVIPRNHVAGLDTPSYIYRYDNPGGYKLLTDGDYLAGGFGYWVNTPSSGLMILDRNAESSPLPKIGSFSEINLDEMDKFIISDADGFSQSLYVSNTDIDTAMVNLDLDLPPLFSEIDFDSRFEYNEYVKKVSADSGTINLDILVHTFSFPVSLTWEINPANGIDYSFTSDSSTGKISSTLATTGNVHFNQLKNNRINLFAKADKINNSHSYPTQYALLQNYPNPFNPSTTIKYDLPNTTDVSLIIYDILGRKVKELVNTKQQAGRYEVHFDASNLTSGVYIYQLITDKYINSKKMILIK